MKNYLRAGVMLVLILTSGVALALDGADFPQGMTTQQPGDPWRPIGSAEHVSKLREHEQVFDRMRKQLKDLQAQLEQCSQDNERSLIKIQQLTESNKQQAKRLIHAYEELIEYKKGTRR